MAENSGDGMTELDRLRAQRAQLAERVRAPWWYLAVFAAVLALMCAVPFASNYLSPAAGSWSPVAALVLYYLLQAALARASGVAAGTRTLRYPSARAAGFTMIAVVAAAVVAEALLVTHGLTSAAIAVGVLATAVGTGCQRAQLRGIRRDLRTGVAAG